MPASHAWPTQRNCDSFYGNPRGKNGESSKAWEAENLVYVKDLPFKMSMGDIPITRIRVHRKIADSLTRVLNTTWQRAGRDQAKIDEWGMSVFSGAYNFRLMRGGTNLSMHAYGVAVDFDAPRNGLGDRTPNFANIPEVRTAFEAEGAIWGGDWNGNGDTLDERRCDGMHWQWARLG